MEEKEMPLGFAMALASNPEAMQVFAILDADERRRIVEGTHSVKSRDEMHRYVNDLTTRNEEKL